MNVAIETFVFTPHESEQLTAAIGHRDVAALAFVADVEACVGAFAFASRGGMKAGLPLATGAHLAAITKAGAELRSALYSLPDDIKLLIDLHLLADGARRRLASDFPLLVEPLEDLVGCISQIRAIAALEAGSGNSKLEDKLVLAIATAYRNRLNLKPSPDEGNPFPAVLREILDYAGQRVPSIAASAGAITALRVRQLLGHFA